MNISKRTIRRGGFSLTEMLIATGIMAIGLVLVATIFPVGVKLTTVTTERSIAAVAADEAFAKVQLYGVRGAFPTTCMDFMYLGNVDVSGDGLVDAADVLDDAWESFRSCYYYPSDPAADDHKYCWSAMCRQVSGDDIQVTVFVNRMMASGVKYYGFPYTSGTGYSVVANYTWPTPVRIAASYDNTIGARVLTLVDSTVGFTAAQASLLLSDGYSLVNDYDGRIYQIEETENADNSVDGTRERIILRQDWKWIGYDADPLNPPAVVQPVMFWVVPPAVNSSRYPCVGVYQKVIRFD